jgi:uncharacterized cupin superfamily protein
MTGGTDLDSLRLGSTAPHIVDAPALEAGLIDWGPHQHPLDGRSVNRGRLLFKAEDGVPEAGLWRSTPGSWQLVLPADELCYFVDGRARYESDEGEVIEVRPGMLVHFKQGWRGRVEVAAEIVVTYMLAAGGPAAATPCLRDPASVPLEEWGPAQTLDAAPAATRGLVLSRQADGRAESGIWECDPARRAVTIGRDEFCHVLSGHALYTHRSGDRIAVGPGTIVFFPGGWSGTCENAVPFRKIYMNR